MFGMFGISINFELLSCMGINTFLEILGKQDLMHIKQAIMNHFFDQKNELGLLTPREKQCLFYTSRGRAAKEIATILNVSPKTVECHWENIKTKLNCTIKSAVIDKYLEFQLLNHLN